MLLQSLRALCKAPGGPGSIWKYLEALVMATGVSGRFACGFRTDLHFADEGTKYVKEIENEGDGLLYDHTGTSRTGESHGSGDHECSDDDTDHNLPDADNRRTLPLSTGVRSRPLDEQDRNRRP